MMGDLLWLTLVHDLWIGLGSAAAIALVLQSRLPLAHHSRYGILLGVLCLVATAPPTLAAFQYLSERSCTWDAALSESPMFVLAPARSLACEKSEPFTRSALHREEMSPTGRSLRALRGTLGHMNSVAQAARPFALTIWSLGVLCLTVRLSLGFSRVSRLCRDAYPAPSTVRQRARRLGRLLRLRRIPGVLVHATLEEPCLCGAIRPVILLPARWLASAYPESLDAVLAHELAHARRLDHLVNLAQRLLETLFFFHPGVRWISRLLRRQCELCADALAVRLTRDPLALAGALESVARFRSHLPASRLVGAPLGGEFSFLLPRIQELLGMKPLSPRPRFWPFVALPLSLAFGALAVSAGVAQDGQSSPDKTATSSRSPLAASQAPAPSSTPPPALKQTAASRLPDRQISYQVRCIDFRAQPRRELFKGRLKPCGAGADGRGWIVDDTSLKALLRRLMSEPYTDVLTWPKATTFENTRSTFSLDLEGRRAMVLCNIRPEPTKIIERDSWKGLLIYITGAFSPRGTQLSVDLRDSARVVVEDHQDGSVTIDAGHDDATPAHLRYKGSCDVPSGSSLLIDLSGHESPAEPKTSTSELVIITPRCIVLEPESPPPGAAVSKPASSLVPR